MNRISQPLRASLALLLLVAAISYLAAATPETPVKIALYDDEGSGGKGLSRVPEILATDHHFALTTLTAEQIRGGALKDYNSVIFTGGSGSKQAKTLGDDGVSQVREFVRGGGGYLGICAGAYLATSGFSWSAKILNAKTISSKWNRGRGDLELELTDEGKKILGDHPGKVMVLYHNGPVIKAADEPSLPAFTPLAYFRTEVAENDTPVGIMVGSPALASAIFGKGRIVFCSPHPEQTPGLEDMILGAVKWISAPHPTP